MPTRPVCLARPARVSRGELGIFHGDWNTSGISLSRNVKSKGPRNKFIVLLNNKPSVSLMKVLIN